MEDVSENTVYGRGSLAGKDGRFEPVTASEARSVLEDMQRRCLAEGTAMPELSRRTLEYARMVGSAAPTPEIRRAVRDEVFAPMAGYDTEQPLVTPELEAAMLANLGPTSLEEAEELAPTLENHPLRRGQVGDHGTQGDGLDDRAPLPLLDVLRALNRALARSGQPVPGVVGVHRTNDLDLAAARRSYQI